MDHNYTSISLVKCGYGLSIGNFRLVVADANWYVKDDITIEAEEDKKWSCRSANVRKLEMGRRRSAWCGFVGFLKFPTSSLKSIIRTWESYSVQDFRSWFPLNSVFSRCPSCARRFSTRSLFTGKQDNTYTASCPCTEQTTTFWFLGCVLSAGRQMTPTSS